MAFAYRNAVFRHQLLKESESLFLPHRKRDRCKPFRVLHFDAQLALEAGGEEVTVALGQILFSERTGVVRLNPDREKSCDPFPVRWHRARDQLPEMRREHRLKTLFPLQRL